LKRFTWLCHLWLGAADGLAPVGAWVAITNHLPWQSWLLGAAVTFWVAGFDFFYALFDLDVDRREGLHSIATRFGTLPYEVQVNARGEFTGLRNWQALSSAMREVMLPLLVAQAKARPELAGETDEAEAGVEPFGDVVRGAEGVGAFHQ